MKLLKNYHQDILLAPLLDLPIQSAAKISKVEFDFCYTLRIHSSSTQLGGVHILHIICSITWKWSKL